MRYLLDTDHLSVLQRQAGKDYSNLSARMDQYPGSDFRVTDRRLDGLKHQHKWINPIAIEPSNPTYSFKRSCPNPSLDDILAADTWARQEVIAAVDTGKFVTSPLVIGH